MFLSFPVGLCYRNKTLGKDSHAEGRVSGIGGKQTGRMRSKNVKIATVGKDRVVQRDERCGIQEIVA